MRCGSAILRSIYLKCDQKTTMQEKDSSLIPVRMLTQYAYCHRLAYMEWVQGEFAYNADVVDGKYKHRNVDAPSGMKRMQEDSEDQRIHARSVMLSDSNLGMIAKIGFYQLQKPLNCIT